MKFIYKPNSKAHQVFYPAILAIISSLLLISCSSTTSLSPAKPTAETVALNIMLPTLNEQHSVKRNGVMSHHETGFYLSTKTQHIELVESVNSVDANYPSIELASTTKLSADINGITGGCFGKANYQNKNIRFCLLDNDNNGYFDQGVFDGELVENLNIQYKINTTEVKSNYSKQIRKQLIYRGITVDKIKFTYLEFNDDMTTPSVKKDFTIGNHRENHILFDYNGAHFKILTADNVNITFENNAYLK